MPETREEPSYKDYVPVRDYLMKGWNPNYTKYPIAYSIKPLLYKVPINLHLFYDTNQSFEATKSIKKV